MRKRIFFAQNNIRDRNLISKLVDISSLSKKDIVLEIGAGTGMITQELLKKCKSVIAFEIDKNLALKLFEKFGKTKGFILKRTDFLKSRLPSFPYKVFSNIPFNKTADVVKKLTQSNNPPEDAYLIMQKEAAYRFMGKPYDKTNSQISVLLKPWFFFEIIHWFDEKDFYPVPRVKCVLVRIQKRKHPLVAFENKKLYENFIMYTYNQFSCRMPKCLKKIFEKKNIFLKKRPGEISFENWLSLFDDFIFHTEERDKSYVLGISSILQAQQKKIKKIHRTRCDKNWKKVAL